MIEAIGFDGDFNSNDSKDVIVWCINYCSFWIVYVFVFDQVLQWSGNLCHNSSSWRQRKNGHVVLSLLRCKMSAMWKLFLVEDKIMHRLRWCGSTLVNLVWEFYTLIYQYLLVWYPIGSRTFSRINPELINQNSEARFRFVTFEISSGSNVHIPSCLGLICLQPMNNRWYLDDAYDKPLIHLWYTYDSMINHWNTCDIPIYQWLTIDTPVIYRYTSD